MIAWDARRATCPAGWQSRSWTLATDKRRNPVIQIKFSMRDGKPCVHHAQCCDGVRRLITIRRRAQYEALQAARTRQAQADFAATYGARAGIEGTISQGLRRCDVRHARYVGVRQNTLAASGKRRGNQLAARE